MYFEPLISTKCCPKLHIKQETIYITFVCEIGFGGRWGSQMKRGGVQEKGGCQDPLTPPSGHAINAQASGMLGWQLEMILVYS